MSAAKIVRALIIHRTDFFLCSLRFLIEKITDKMRMIGILVPA